MPASSRPTQADCLIAIRDLVEAAECAGWDLTENKAVLNAARDAYAALADDLVTRPAFWSKPTA